MAVAAFGQNSFVGDSWKTVNQTGQGKLSIVYYECPKLIEDTGGTPQGVCVDIMNDFVQFVKTKYNKTIRLEFVNKESDFGQFLKTVKSSSNVMGVSNVTITDDRKAEMKFSPYFLKTPLVILTNKSAPTFTSLKDLAASGLGGEVEKETSYAAFMQKLKSDNYPKMNIQYTASTSAVVDDLSLQNKYFSVMDFTEYLGEVKSNPNVKRQPINLGTSVQLGFIMSKKSDWDTLFNEFLNDEYRNSTSYKKNVAKYLGANFMSLVK